MPKHGRNTSLVGDDKSVLLDSLYCKDVAVWVPHLLLPDHVPTCPKCESSECVCVASSKWIKQPKLLYGIRSHRYLDTKMYKCHGINCGG